MPEKGSGCPVPQQKVEHKQELCTTDPPGSRVQEKPVCESELPAGRPEGWVPSGGQPQQLRAQLLLVLQALAAPNRDAQFTLD